MSNSTRLMAAVAALLATGSAAHAENWEFVPRVEVGYEYNDNYRLDFPGLEIDVSGPMLDASLPIRLVDPIRKAEIAPRVRANYFPDEGDEDSTDYYLTGLFEQRTQRQFFGIEGEINREDVVRSELPSSDIGSGLGDPSTGDAGRVLFRNRRDLIRFEPEWRYDLTERHRIEAGGHYIDADFERDTTTVNGITDYQQDFTDYGVYAGWGFLLSQRQSITLRARASQYETSFDADAVGAEVEWRTDYSQTTELYARLGGQETSLDRGSGSSENSIIGGAGGRWTWPTTNLFADLTRSVGPTSAGVVVERDQFRLKLSRAIQPRLSVLAGLRATRDDAIDSETYPEREYISGDLGFDWRITRTWSLVGEYSYVWQEYSDEPSDRSSNAIRLGVVYEPGRGE